MNDNMVSKIRIAVYGRVSTEHEEQLYALSNQIQYYQDYINSNPLYELYDMYIDEGITGTSAKKRPNFLRMMKDANEHKFDMVITREVSRFARNTVDTLSYTRELKKLNIPAYFMSDNINTFDKDGELRLTIMASLAQDESRKTSERVKHGQKKSMENGVAYGTGNIIGYDRVNGKYVVNEEQASIVKMIYKIYLEGKGSRVIKFELERLGCKNSQGGIEWWYTTILRILQNPFYCGRVVMRKEVVTDFLEQKRIKNNGIVEKIVRKGSHEPLVSEEDFDNAQEILKSKTQKVDMTNIRGKRENKYLWSGKIFCGNCGSVYKRTNWHKLSDGTRIYAYWCTLRAKNGTTQNRNTYNAPLDNVCDSVAIPEWKFDNIAKIIIANLWENRAKTLQVLEESIQTFAVDVDYTNDALAIKKGIEKYEKKIKNLIDMRSDGEITKDEFLTKRKEFDDYINKQNMIMKTYDTKLQQAANREIRIQKIKEFMQSELDFSQPKLPDEIVDLIIRKVVVYSNKKFKFYIINEGEVDIDLDEIKKAPNFVHSSTGGHKERGRPGTEVSAVYIKTFNISCDDVCYSIGKPVLKQK